MPITEQEIQSELGRELAEAKKRGQSGQITVTVDLNQGNIARAEINLGRHIRAQAQPREARFDGGVR